MVGTVGLNLTQCSIKKPFCVPGDDGTTITLCCGDVPAAIASIIVLILKIIGFILLGALLVGCAATCCCVACIVAGTCGGIALCGACVESSARSSAPLPATDRTALLSGEHGASAATVIPVAVAAPIVTVATAETADDLPVAHVSADAVEKR